MLKVFCVFIISIFSTSFAMAIEEPSYKLLLNQNGYEVREYMPMLIAEVVVDGTLDDASSKGFKLIANYIFGNNKVPGSNNSDKISMTAPVTIEPQSAKIAMTAPVTIEPNISNSSIEEAAKWRVHFVMPSQYTLANIPKPNNDAVLLRELPQKYFVVYRYSGFNTLSKIQSLMTNTENWIKASGFKIKGTPQLSRYDPPWTLPMFRRNEIMIEIDNPHISQLK